MINILLILRKGSYNGEFATFKLSTPSYGAEKHIAATEVNILLYIIFFTAYETAAASERLKIFYKLIKDYQKRSIVIKRRYYQLEAGYRVLKWKTGTVSLREKIMLEYYYKYLALTLSSSDRAADKQLNRATNKQTRIYYFPELQIRTLSLGKQMGTKSSPRSYLLKSSFQFAYAQLASN